MRDALGSAAMEVEMDAFPVFLYFDNPREGLQRRFEASDAPCECCGRARGWIYTGGMFGGERGVSKDPLVCPWCIADGSAAAWYPGSFNTVASGASPESVEAVERRTPAIITWQDPIWPVCCGEACIFLGQAQHEQLTQTWPEAGAALLATYEPGWLGTETPEEFLEWFKSECDPGGYAFQCCACGRWRVEWDIS